MMFDFERTPISFLWDRSNQSPLPSRGENTRGERHIKEVCDERCKKIDAFLEETSVEGVDRRGLVR